MVVMPYTCWIGLERTSIVLSAIVIVHANYESKGSWLSWISLYHSVFQIYQRVIARAYMDFAVLKFIVALQYLRHTIC
jgi:hypothetical protein